MGKDEVSQTSSIRKIASFEEIVEMLSYDPETGIFRWRCRSGVPSFWNSQNSGNEAGTIDSYGYRIISIWKTRFKAHRLAWLLYYGAMPEAFIDHINGVKDDNRIVNLRSASFSQNQYNRTSYANNTSGRKGVTWCKMKNKWRAQIKWNDGRRKLGYFNTVEEAYAAYCKASEIFHGKFSNVSSGNKRPDINNHGSTAPR